MKIIRTITLAAGMVFSPHLLYAQTLTISSFNNNAMPVQPATPDSIVQVTAEAQGLQLVSPENLPPFGTYWEVMPYGIMAPLPCPPFNPALPVYAITDNIFLVDATGGQLPANPHQTAAMSTAAAVNDAEESLATAVVNLINQVQTAQANQQTRMMAWAMGIDVPSPGGGDGGDYSSMFSGGTPINTNGLWLQITNYDGNFAYVNLNNATDQVYSVWTSTNLLIGWQVEEELWPTTARTNVLPFKVPTLNQPILFVRAEDWTGVTENGNTTPDWWFWQNFGTTALSDSNLDGYGNTLLSDYQNGTDPNILQFSIQVTNDFVASMNVPVSLNVFAGVPSFLAVSVDDTNYENDANWTAYTSSNLNVNLGINSGWHAVWIGLRGFADATNQAAWRYVRLKLNYSPPVLVITNPTASAISVPLVQIKGYTAQNLASVTYDISNATGVVTGQDGGITDKYYDTTTWELTTNNFEAVDVPLAAGLNVITLHATDMSGNTMTTNINLTLDYSTRTNPPTVQLFWPRNGEQISGTSFTWRGWVDDPMATVSAQIIGADGRTNKLNGLVERNGNFWVENFPMPNGSNRLTLMVADSAGNIATTNITVSTCPFTVTMTPIPDAQLWDKYVTATGTISDSSQSLWINGVKAGITNGVWTANNVPMTDGGVANFKVTCYAPGETQPDGSTGN